MKLGLLLSLALFAAFVVPVDSTAADQARSKPNVVLIFIDDMGYGDIGPFGNTKIKTPNLDRFASEGMKFTSFYATPVCSMSRACLMTGCYNARVSIPGVLFPRNNIGLHTNELTLAEIVKPQGYSTICIGKWRAFKYWCQPCLTEIISRYRVFELLSRRDHVAASVSASNFNASASASYAQ